MEVFKVKGNHEAFAVLETGKEAEWEIKTIFFFAVCVIEREREEGREGGRKSNQYTGALPFQNNVSQAIWDGEGSIYGDKVDLK